MVVSRQVPESGERHKYPMVTIRQQNYTYDTAQIVILDPLGGDELLARLPQMNAAADLSAMVNAVRVLLPTIHEVAAFSFEECLAAMRDLGLFLGSIKRHGQQPVALVSELEPVLLELGRRTDMIPRDTVHHYTEWNPRGPRQRMYTGKPRESVLMNGVRLSLLHLYKAVEACSILSHLTIDEPDFGDLLQTLALHVDFFQQAITDVVEKVTPEFFAQALRPYFEEITIRGVSYLGPAAAHVPLFLLDLAIWASDHQDSTYDTFLHESARHTLPPWRSLLPVWKERPSLVTHVCTALLEVRTDEIPPALLQAAETLFTVLHTLAVFRGKHFGIAKKAYREEVRLYEVGSGGGSLVLLRTILDLTRQNASLVRQARGGQKEE